MKPFRRNPLREIQSVPKETAPAATNSYTCPFCGFTAGVLLGPADPSGEVETVRCFSCCRTSQQPRSARAR
jgi:predicted RNA-binding Zn-ribbon protein involved in translation (DUF1610 family)